MIHDLYISGTFGVNLRSPCVNVYIKVYVCIQIYVYLKGKVTQKGERKRFVFTGAFPKCP